MYCPKCKETFEEGSRRFCPTDGARLISDKVGAPIGGIFSNLLPKINFEADRDETLSVLPEHVVSGPETRVSEDGATRQHTYAEPFFEISDIPSEIETIPNFTTPGIIEEAPAELKALGRKVNPYEIPAGHVEIGDSERTAGLFNEFDAGDPESFVGRMVKGRYRVAEFLGGDGSGFAYLADDKIVEDKMVLVRILLEDGSDEIMESILAEERVSLSHFTHPNIARLIDSGEFIDGTRFLISEYTDALSVRDILGIHGQFDAQRAARVIRQASYALNEAHQEGIIHRDIRPENLILSAETGTEQTKLVNFGASNGEPNSYNAAYKAPEVLDGRISTVSSDIFSLAVVAYEMLTGNMPFSGSTAKEIVRLQYAGLAVQPSTIRPDLPSAVDEILSRALLFNAASRFVKARDFGDSFHNALAELPQPVSVAPKPTNAVGDTASLAGAVPLPAADKPASENKVEILKPLVSPPNTKPIEPAWKNRSPEPPQVETSRAMILTGVGLLALMAILGLGWYYLVNHPTESGVLTQSEQNSAQNNGNSATPATASDIEVPPLPRKIVPPANSEFYQNGKQNLKGDLLRNFVGFSIYYPKDWKVNGPQESSTLNSRGKFLDISRVTPGGQLKEQMLISYYQSKGTFKDDQDKFAQMLKETNETLKTLLPGYQMVSEGETKVNGDWRAYEIKFQGGANSDKGQKLVVWGRRLFIPAERPGVRNGFEITMIATSLADDIRSVDDVGVRGELAPILYSFEPGQNF